MSGLSPKELYLRENGWDWKLPKSKKKKTPVFRYGSIELLRPTVTMYRE